MEGLPCGILITPLETFFNRITDVSSLLEWPAGINALQHSIQVSTIDVINDPGPEGARTDCARHQVRTIEAECFRICEDLCEALQCFRRVPISRYVVLRSDEETCFTSTSTEAGVARNFITSRVAAIVNAHAEQRAGTQHWFSVSRVDRRQVEIIHVFTNHGSLGEEVGNEARLAVQEAARWVIKQREGCITKVGGQDSRWSPPRT